MRKLVLSLVILAGIGPTSTGGTSFLPSPCHDQESQIERGACWRAERLKNEEDLLWFVEYSRRLLSENDWTLLSAAQISWQTSTQEFCSLRERVGSKPFFDECMADEADQRLERLRTVALCHFSKGCWSVPGPDNPISDPRGPRRVPNP